MLLPLLLLSQATPASREKRAHGLQDLRGGSTSAADLVISAWAHRMNDSYAPLLEQELAKQLRPKELGGDVELFLPQIGHIIVTLPADSPHACALERFVLRASERNIHFALQLAWIIQSALEDNSPGQPDADASVYARCARLLAHIEQAVVFGARMTYTTRRENVRRGLRTAAEALVGASKGALSLDARRVQRPTDLPTALVGPRKNAVAATSDDDDVTTSGFREERPAQLAPGAGPLEGVTPALSGTLWLIAGSPSAFYLSSLLGLSRDGYRPLRVALVESTLFYGDRRGGGYRGAIPLAHARVETRQSRKGYSYIRVASRYTPEEVRLRTDLLGGPSEAASRLLGRWCDALSEATGVPRAQAGRKAPGARWRRWLARLFRPAAALRRFFWNRRRPARAAGDDGRAPPHPHPHHHGATYPALSWAQRRSQRFLLCQRDFVHALCGMTAELYTAAEPRQQLRSRLAKLEIPALCYDPLCVSSDTFARLVRIPPDEAVVFITQARSSILVLAEVLVSRSGRTVADLFTPSALAPDDAGANHGPGSASRPAPRSRQGRTGEGDVSGAAARRIPGAVQRALATASHLPAAAASPLERRLGRLVGAVMCSRRGRHRATAAEGTAPAPADESWTDKVRRVRQQSPRGGAPNWALRSFIVKANDDLRQEVFIAQLITLLHRAFPAPLHLRPYHILATSSKSGLIETVPGALSLDHLKKRYYRRTGRRGSLLDIFHERYGRATAELHRAQLAFTRSLAAYAIATFVLAIKDRHNGNILLDEDGHLVHIDFGFALGLAPGGRYGLEKGVPFKLTDEMVEVMGGEAGELYRSHFPALCTAAMRAAREQAPTIITLVEIMKFRSKLRCFDGAPRTLVDDLRKRLMVDVADADVPERVAALIATSRNKIGHVAYDRYQELRNGYFA